jgi:hypothetical protein
LVLIAASPRRQAFDAEGPQQKIGQGFDKSRRVPLEGWFGFFAIQFENKLRWIEVLASPHCPSPSSLKDGIVRLGPDSRRMSRG